MIPVISLRKQFGLPNVEDIAETKIIILEIDGAFLGINVDDVDEVVEVPSSTVEYPNGLTGETNIIRGIAKLDDYLLILIDIWKLFAAEQYSCLL